MKVCPLFGFHDTVAICSILFSFPLVSIPPGWMAMTRLLVFLSSNWRFSVQPRNPHLLAPYTEKCSYGLNPIVAPILTISASFFRIIGKSLLVSTIGATILSLKVRSVFHQLDLTISSPSPSHAQLTSKEKSEYFSSIILVAARTCDSSVKSVLIQSINSAGFDRQSPTTIYPFVWKISAIAFPRPEEAQVRTIVFIWNMVWSNCLKTRKNLSTEVLNICLSFVFLVLMNSFIVYGCNIFNTHYHIIIHYMKTSEQGAIL